MNLEITRAFVKDAERLPKNKKKVILEVINEIQSAKTPYEIKECSKLKGVEDFYRIRRGNYRITFEYTSLTVVLKRVITRGQIYKKHNT